MIRHGIPGIVAALVAAGALAGETDGMERYRVILERHPFGRPEAPAAPPPAAPAEDAAFAQNLRVSTLIEDAQGVRVGLADAANRRSYLLRVGDDIEGIELVRADFRDETVVLRRGGEEAVLRLQAGPRAPTPAARAARGRPGTDAADPSSPRGRWPRRRAAGDADDDGEDRGRPRMTREEMEAHLRQYSVEVIRQGLPPLPVQLTPEDDAMLVREGVLPPQ